MRPALIILCGGASSRMGRDKAALPWGDSTLLAQLVARLKPACAATFVVAAPGQIVPALPDDVHILRDPSAHEGPLAGAIVGLRAVGEWGVDRGLLLGCDAPFVAPSLVEFLSAHLANHRAAVVEHDGILQPLLALVRTEAVETLQAAWVNGERSLRRCLESLDIARIPSDTLRTIDPELKSLVNLNTFDQYERLRPKP